MNGMKLFVFLLLCVTNAWLSQSKTVGENDDGFRRLLRRASAEADRPLVREQRKNKEEDDEDVFDFPQKVSDLQLNEDLLRNRRAAEDDFYRMLLSRSDDAKQTEKRSFDTDDVESKSGFIIREDWTGDSKISNADRQELESLFSTLNAVEEPAKKEQTRSAPDGDDAGADGVALSYANWLMGLPMNKMGAALVHKADVDHELTKFLVKDKRDATHPDRFQVEKKPISSQKSELAKPVSIKYPEPSDWRSGRKQTQAAGQKKDVQLAAPRNMTSAVAQKNDSYLFDRKSNISGSDMMVDAPVAAELHASSSSLQAPVQKKDVNIVPSLCTSPQCLCERSCAPVPVENVAPCKCGKGFKVTMNEKNITGDPNIEVIVPGDNTNSKINGLQAADGKVVDPVASLWCQQACNPLQVSTLNPCKCAAVSPVTSNVLAAAVPPPLTPAAASQAAACARSCFPRQVTATSPCGCADVATTLPQSPPVPIAMKKLSSPYYIAKWQETQKPVTSAASRAVPAAGPAENSFLTKPLVAMPSDYLSIRHKSYQGCFKDRKPLRDLPKRFTRYQTTPEACVQECRYQNYLFAGLQYGYLCFCGNGFGRYGREKDEVCNSLCEGDPTRYCGSFWHNSVYSVDNKEYDPSDFNFEKIDAEERARDTMPAPLVAMQSQQRQASPSESQVNVNVANHLMKAAQAALKAAKQLLPSVSRKSKVRSVKRAGKSPKQKREDSEQDELFQQHKMAALASLGAVRQLMQHHNFGVDKRHAEKEKRSLDEDSEPYDAENGKELLVAFLSNVDAYRRQVRSVDDDDDEDDVSDKAKFEYKRLNVGESEDGEFVEKYDEDRTDPKDKRSVSDSFKRKRSTEDDFPGPISDGPSKAALNSSDREKRVAVESERSLIIVQGAVLNPSAEKSVAKTKRSLAEVGDFSVSNTDVTKTANLVGSGDDSKRRRSLAKKNRSLDGSGDDSKRKRSLSGSGDDSKKKRSLTENDNSWRKQVFLAGSGDDSKKKRSIVGSGDDSKKKRSIHGSGDDSKKKRFILGSGDDSKKKRSTLGSGDDSRKKRSILGSGDDSKKKRSILGSGDDSKKKRSIHGSGDDSKKKRSILGSGDDSKKKRSILGSGDDSKKKRSILGRGDDSKKKRSIFGSGDDSKKKRSILEISDEKENSLREKSAPAVDVPSVTNVRKTRSMDRNERILLLPHLNKALDRQQRSVEVEVIEPDEMENNSHETGQAEDGGEDDSGSESGYPSDENGEEDELQEKESLKTKRSATLLNDDQIVLNRRARSLEEDLLPVQTQKLPAGNAAVNEQEATGRLSLISRAAADDSSGDESGYSESDEAALISKRSLDVDDGSPFDKTFGENEQKVRSSIEKGVDNLLSLVVQLYKQQKTINDFQAAVRSLRSEILGSDDLKNAKRSGESAHIRNRIRTIARDRLHALTGTIESKIREFSASHPDAIRQVDLAASLLTGFPLSKDKYKQAKREIARRAAEFEDLEDAFASDSEIPNILKDHFKRNSEVDLSEKDEKQLVGGEEKLSRMHRDVLASQQETIDDQFDRLLH